MLNLPDSDVVVAATTFRDYVLVFTRHGRIYRIYDDPQVANEIVIQEM